MDIIKTATATIDSATGTKADFRATGTGVLTNGALSSITLTDSGSFYAVAPVVTIDSATGNKSAFRATARATIDSSSGELATLVITDSGNFMIMFQQLRLQHLLLRKILSEMRP